MRIGPQNKIQYEHEVHDVKILKRHRQLHGLYYECLAATNFVHLLEHASEEILSVRGILSPAHQKLHSPLQQKEGRYRVAPQVPTMASESSDFSLVQELQVIQLTELSS